MEILWIILLLTFIVGALFILYSEARAKRNKEINLMQDDCDCHTNEPCDKGDDCCSNKDGGECCGGKCK